MLWPGYTVDTALAGSLQTISTSYKTLIGLNASSGTALKRIGLAEFEFGQPSAPNSTDSPVLYDVSTMTAAGTGSSATPNPTVNGADTALTVATVNYSSEPTVTSASSVYNRGANQRDKAGWLSNPGGELFYPATNLKGPVMRGQGPNTGGPYAGNMTCRCIFGEP